MNKQLFSRETANFLTPTFPDRCPAARSRRRMGAFCLLLGLLLLPVASQAQFTTITNSGAIVITSYTGPDGSVTVPATLNGLPVRGIGEGAFYGRRYITSVALPNSVTIISNWAFYSCLGLTSFTFPTNLLSIGDCAFFGCSGLRSLTIPDTVTNLGGGIFYGCVSLGTIRIGNSVPTLNGWRDTNSPEVIYGVLGACLSLTNLTIGSSVSRIDEWALASCSSLRNLTLPNSLSIIGNWAFYSCSSLTNITIPRNVIWIGAGPFASCYNLTSIGVHSQNTIFDSVNGVLFNQSQTVLLQCPGAKTGSYTIPSTVTNVNAGAFSGCGNLTNIIIPTSVRSIGQWAFEVCSGLTSMWLPFRLTNISDNMFSGCSSLSQVTFTGSGATIGRRAFEYCENLTGLYFRSNAPVSISADAFYSATNVTLYYLPGTTNWPPIMAGRPTALWRPKIESFVYQTNRVLFTMAWTSNRVVIVEASTNMANPTWTPLLTNTLVTHSRNYTNSSLGNARFRFYRLRSP